MYASLRAGLYFSNIDWFDPDMRIDQVRPPPPSLPSPPSLLACLVEIQHDVLGISPRLWGDKTSSHGSVFGPSLQWNAVAAAGKLCDGIACDPKLYNKTTNPEQYARPMRPHTLSVFRTSRLTLTLTWTVGCSHTLAGGVASSCVIAPRSSKC